MISAIYPGSFDPIHIGHEDVIKRAANIVDFLYVAVLDNSNKKHFWSLEKRLQVIEEIFKDYDNIKVVTFKGLLFDYCKNNDIDFIVKGLRNSLDFQLEIDMAHGIKKLGDVETLFIPCSIECSYISSTLVRDMYSTSKNVENMVSQQVLKSIGR